MATFLGYDRDTVAVALNYFDRYTCARPCSPTTAQAVAATALHLAAKFEETNPASLVRDKRGGEKNTPTSLLVAAQWITLVPAYVPGDLRVDRIIRCQFFIFYFFSAGGEERGV